MKAIDLFAGIGGFRVAMEQAGHEVVFSSEIDRHAADAYEQNFGEKPTGDITQVASKDIPAHDILCGGFPCQSFSISGKHKGFRDARGQLFYEIIRIAKHHTPRLMILENVPNIQTMQKGKVFAAILSELKAAGYHCQVLKMNAGHYGFAQARIRIYFVCTHKKLPPITIPKRNAHKTLSLFLQDKVDEKWFVKTDDLVLDKDKIPSTSKNKTVRIGQVRKGGQGDRIYHPLGYAITLAANSGGTGRKTGLYYVNDRIRRLTTTECKRIMGFPEDHHVSDGEQGLKQLGNAIVPGMVSLVLEQVTC